MGRVLMSHLQISLHDQYGSEGRCQKQGQPWRRPLLPSVLFVLTPVLSISPLSCLLQDTESAAKGVERDAKRAVGKAKAKGNKACK